MIDKSGPQVLLVAPSAARLKSLSLAPRMLISLYGNNLTGSIVTVNYAMLDSASDATKPTPQT